LRDSANQQAWEEFVEIYTPLVHGFFCQRGLQAADAADLAQEVMRAVARTMPNFEYQPDKGRFSSWLFTISRNKFNSFLDKRRRAPFVSGGTDVQKQIEAQPCPEVDPIWERDFQRRVFSWACEQVRSEFQETTWQAFWRAGVEEQAVSAVAQSLGLSAGAVYVAKSRVLARLREKVEEASGDTALFIKE
jgi:RNA polymerase sigma-70 factor (ECF subfamily)